MKAQMLETAYFMATETHIIIGAWKSYDAYKRFSRYSSSRWAAGEDHGRIHIIWMLLSKGKWVNIKD